MITKMFYLIILELCYKRENNIYIFSLSILLIYLDKLCTKPFGDSYSNRKYFEYFVGALERCFATS